MILHVIYIGLQCYGWYHWLHGGRDEKQLSVTVLSALQTGLWLSVTVIGSIAWGSYMASATDASLPYGDAFTTVASLTAQWLMIRKKVESWLERVALSCINFVLSKRFLIEA